jgi:hypothetical protein
MATPLSRSHKVVARYLAERPLLAKDVEGDIDLEKPVPGKIDFWSQVMADPTLDEETRHRWLALCPE